MSLADALEEERKAVLAMQKPAVQHRPVKSLVLDEPQLPAHHRSKSVSTGSQPGGWNQQARPNILVSGPEGLLPSPAPRTKSRSTSPSEAMYNHGYSNHSTTSTPGLGVGLGHPKSGKVPAPPRPSAMKSAMFSHMGGATPFGASNAGNVDDVLLRNLDQLMRDPNGPGAQVRSRSANDSMLYPAARASSRSTSRMGSRAGSRSGSRAGSRSGSPTRSPSRERSIYDEALRADYDDDDYFDDDDDDDSDDDDEEDDDTDASSEEDEEDGYSKKKKGKWSGLDTSLVSSNALSLMGAMEDERKSVAQSKFRTKSLMDQAIDPAHPPPPSHQDIAAYRRRIVHPHTAFDAAKLIEQDAKLGVAPYTGYKEEVKDAAAASTMALTVSTIASNANTKRTIRTVTRGDLPDLVGTAISPPPGVSGASSSPADNGPVAPAIKVEDAANGATADASAGDAGVAPEDNVPSTSVAASVVSAMPTPVILPYRPKAYMVCTDLSPESSYALEWTVGTVLRDGSVLYCVCTYGEDEGARPEAAESDRLKAIGEITHQVVKLLKKTRLQVHVVIEVVHCKNPKYMLCEMIDHVSPTLVIVGSRGRSALKGVLLGSFSNYIVGKSSVPVMVARRRLKKSKAHHVNVRQSNNLREGHGGLGLSAAKVD